MSPKALKLALIGSVALNLFAVAAGAWITVPVPGTADTVAGLDYAG